MFNPFKKKPKFILDEVPLSQVKSDTPTPRPKLKFTQYAQPKPVLTQDERTKIYNKAYSQVAVKGIRNEARKQAREDYELSKKSKFEQVATKVKKYAIDPDAKKNVHRIAKSGISLSKKSPLDETFMR